MPKKQVITKSALVPTVLITGGAGFIGSHLTEALLDNGARVIVIDNFKTGKKVYVKEFLANKNFALYDADINNGIPAEIQSIDYIFHLAGLEEYLYSKDFVDLDSLFTNSLGTKNLLDLAQRSNAKFLLVSTIDVYQGRMSQLYLDKYFGITPSEENKFSLIEAKRFAEAVVWEYFKAHNVDARIVRLPEVYGPRMDLSSSGFLGGYVKNVIDSTSIEVLGEGTQKEYYLYISDVVSGLVKAQFNAKTKGNIYSLVPEDSVSALETAYMVKSLADANLAVVFKQEAASVKPQLNSVDTYNVKDLNWRPKVELKEGIAKTLEGFGYTVNVHAFKPAKYVDQKIQEIKKKEEPDKVSSLQGVVEQKPILPKAIKEFSPTISVKVNSHDEPKIFSFKKPASKKSNLFSSLREKLKRSQYKAGNNLGLGANIAAVIFSALLIFVILPVATGYLSINKAVSSLEKAKISAMQLDAEKLSQQTTDATANFRSARLSLRKIQWLFTISGKKQYFTSYDKLLGSLYSFSKALNTASSSIQPMRSALNALRPDSTDTLNTDSLTQAKFSLSEAKNYVSLAQADALGIDNTLFPKTVQPKVLEYQSYLSQAGSALDNGFLLMSELPQILGANHESNYVFWFQNSNEIRPTGGFIGSYGVLTLDKGKIKNFVIDDIYNPDGQIDERKINVTPPDQIATFLKEKVLYLRNSNWDPDFPRATKVFDDLYFKVTGESIDGYIALDLEFVKNLLNVTGPLFLAPYNEEINTGNVYERSQYYSSFDYKEGSTDKKSFLTVLGTKLLEDLFSLKQENYPQLVNQLKKSLDERHFLVYFTNNSIDELLKQNKWDGSLVDTAGDYLSVVNANLGGTKSNYFVKNKMTYEINSMTRDGLLRANLYLDYKHTAENNAWPGGPYTDYVRVLTQNGSKLTGATITINSGSAIDIFKEIVVGKEGNYNSFETSFKINPQDTARLTLNYDLPVNLSLTKDQENYNFYWQKQPGTSQDEYSFTINPPFGMNVVTKSSNLVQENNSLKSNGIFAKDLMFSAIFK